MLGSGLSRARTTSTGSSSPSSSSRARTKERICGSSSVTWRGVNPRPTIRRKAVWSGGSSITIGAKSPTRSSSASPSVMVSPRALEYVAVSRAAAYTSAKRLSTQNPPASCTGSVSRSSAYAAHGLRQVSPDRASNSGMEHVLARRRGTRPDRQTETLELGREVGMELEGLYRDIVEGSTDGFWLLDLDGNTVYANPALQAMFGYTGEEFGRLSAYDLLDDPGREQFTRHLEEAQRGERHGQDVECMYLRADGEPLWVLVSESPMRAPDGTLVGLLHRVSDYSARRRILDELTESKRQLAEGQRIARIGTWEWDVQRDQITGSEGLRLLYDIRPDFFPATYAKVLESVHDDDMAAVEAAMQQALAGEDQFTFEARIEGAPGQWIWTRGRGVVHRDESGSVVAVTGTHQDITEAKLAEIALEDQVVQNTLMQAIASAANEAHTLEDVLVQAGSLVLLHDDWERARAFVPAEDGSRVVPFYVRPDDRGTDDATPEVSAMELELANHSFAANQPVWDEQRLTIAFPIRYDGAVFAVVTITSAPPLYRHELIQTMVEHVAVQLGRVVERQIAERALADARDAAMEASQQKSEFLATMSHEIRTPLNGVIGLNDLLLRTHLDADQQRLASGVQGASRALLDLINDILDFSKIEAGKLELETVDFEVRGVLDQVANVLGEAARAKGLELGGVV